MGAGIYNHGVLKGQKYVPWQISREGPDTAVLFNIGPTELADVEIQRHSGATEVLELDSASHYVKPGGFFGVRFRVGKDAVPSFVVQWRWPNGSKYGDYGMQTLSFEHPAEG